jgi:aspartate oxidase
MLSRRVYPAEQKIRHFFYSIVAGGHSHNRIADVGAASGRDSTRALKTLFT